jgi:nucleotidyltransferase/DNA polymerase involved in DNA repair
MSESYYLNLEEISLDQFRQTLKEAELIPSRRILKEDLDGRFSRLQDQGISTLAEFLAAVKNKTVIAGLAKQAGLSEEYLTILRREVSALLPKPKSLRDFPGIDTSIVQGLEERGIKNSKQLFENALSKAQRQQLAAVTGVDPDKLVELVKLADLSRVYGVGPVFARLLYDTGMDSVQAIARADSAQLFEQLAEAYLAAGNSRVDFKERDIAFCIQMAKRLPGSPEC